MAKYAIWGHNKYGEAKCFALYVEPSEMQEYLERAKAEGWTDLKSDLQAQPSLFDDPETPESDSSDEPRSHPRKPASSGTSGVA